MKTTTKRILLTIATICAAVVLVATLIPALSVTTNAESQYTWEIPIKLTVGEGGSAEAPAHNFEFELRYLDGSKVDLAAFEGGFINNSPYVETSGIGTYTTTLSFRGGDELMQSLSNGFIVVLKDSGEDGWVYDEAKYEVSVWFDGDGTMNDISIISCDSGAYVNYVTFECEYTGWYLHFETNGGSTIGAVASANGTTIYLSGYTPTRDGYTFNGWYSDDNLQNKIDSITLNQESWVYAGWESQGSVTVGAVTLAEGQYTTDGATIATTPTDNYAYYSGGVLYLKNFTYTGTGGTSSKNAVIKPISGDLTVSLAGTNSISGEGYGFYSNVGSITFKSTSDTEQGILTVSAYVNTIYGSSSSEIVIDNVIIKSSGANIYSGISTTIKNGANIEASGISSGNMITISYSTVVVESTGTAMVAGGLYIIASEITLNGKLQVGEGTINPATNGTWQIDYGTSATDCQSMTYSSELSIADEKNYRNWGSCTYFRVAEHVHTYTSEVTKEATCTSTGTTTYTCTLCNNSYEETVAKVDHTVVADLAVEPTCTETGLTEGSHCSVCNEVIVAQTEVPANGHTKVTDEAVEATCTETGLTEGSHCSVCNEVFVAQTVVAATGHSYEATVTAPTCTEGGYTTYTCSVCGDTYTADETEPTGHTHLFTEFTWASDLLSANAVYTCHCGDTVTAEATVTMQGDNGVYTMTATITDSDGTVHTDTQTAGVNLSTIAADYSSVNEAIAKANALSASNYTNFSDVTAAINKVQWNLSVLNQSTVAAYAEAIETAIANLVPVDTEVTIDEPVENTDTEPETDEAEAETSAEENPTTGAVIALLPIAVAIAGVISRKRLG